MSTVAEQNNPFVSDKWTLDETTGQITSQDQPGLVVSVVEEGDTKRQAARAVRTFCQHARRLHLEERTVKGRPPRIFLTIDESELENSMIDGVFTIEIKRRDGKVGRVHLSIGPSTRVSGGVNVELNTPSRDKDYVKHAVVHFADWTK
jgi:hypothetical protein